MSQITAIIQSCASRLRNVKMITKDYATNQFITISPDTVYSRMLELVQLLPNDASNWGFCLPWLYFEALSYNLQDDLRDSSYVPPPPINLLTKSAQLEGMVDCRDRARIAHKKMKDLKKHVTRAMNQKSSPSHRSNFLSEDCDIDGGVEDVGNEDPAGGNPYSVNYNANSRAELGIAWCW